MFPACFSCSNNFYHSQSSSGSDDKNIVLETSEAETINLGDFSNLVRVLSPVGFLPKLLNQKAFLFAKSNINFLSDKLARSTLKLLLVIIFNRSPFNLNSLPVSRNVNLLFYKVNGIVLCINKSLTLFGLESFSNLN